MTDDEKEQCKKWADEFLYGPRMQHHAQFRHFALMKVQDIYNAGKEAGRKEAEKKE